VNLLKAQDARVFTPGAASKKIRKAEICEAIIVPHADDAQKQQFYWGFCEKRGLRRVLEL
jgi:hypothetical protein